MVLAGAVDPAPLRAAGWSLRGTLSRDPYGPADRLDAATYVDVDELLEDAGVDAVAVDGDDRDLAPLLPALRDSGCCCSCRPRPRSSPTSCARPGRCPSPPTPPSACSRGGSRGRGPSPPHCRSPARRPSR
jgi:hypothetical protein